MSSCDVTTHLSGPKEEYALVPQLSSSDPERTVDARQNDRRRSLDIVIEGAHLARRMMCTNSKKV
jgi:hypothetical protein